MLSFDSPKLIFFMSRSDGKNIPFNIFTVMKFCQIFCHFGHDICFEKCSSGDFSGFHSFSWMINRKE